MLPKQPFREMKDGRVILGTKLYSDMRRELCALASNLCENCGLRTPFERGDVHHDSGRGGGKRDDRIFVNGERNLFWYCRTCHSGKHVPAKVVPAKVSQDELRKLLGL